MNSPFSFEGEGGRGDEGMNEGRSKDQMSLLYFSLTQKEYFVMTF